MVSASTATEPLARAITSCRIAVAPRPTSDSRTALMPTSEPVRASSTLSAASWLCGRKSSRSLPSRPGACSCRPWSCSACSCSPCSWPCWSCSCRCSPGGCSCPPCSCRCSPGGCSGSWPCSGRASGWCGCAAIVGWPSGDRGRHPSATDPQWLAHPSTILGGTPVARRGGFGIALRILARAQLAQRVEQLVELRHLDILLDAALGQLLSEHLVEMEHGGRIGDVDLDP